MRPAAAAPAVGGYQPQGLDELVEAQVHACQHVATRLHEATHAERGVGRDRGIEPQVQRLAAGTTGEPDDAEPRSDLWQQRAGAGKAVAQPGVLLVDAVQLRQFSLEFVEAARQGIGTRRREVDARPARHHEIEQVALAEGRLGRAQQPLLQAQELREPEGEARVVAERAEVAEVVGDALELERERPQPRGARRQLDRAHLLERPAVRPRAGDGRVAGHAGGEAMPLEDRQIGEASLDALVHIAETLLEPEHLLANDREAEMTRLYDAGVHRTDGNLVDPVPRDPYERIVVDWLPGGWR